MHIYRSHVLVCGGTGCHSSNSSEILDKFKEKLILEKLEDEVQVIMTGCFGLCEHGPIVIVYPEGAFYSQIKIENVETIVNEHLLKGRVCENLLYQDSVHNDKTIKSLNEMEFYKKQKRTALRNCGVIDPENIDEYIALDGYKALEKALLTMTPQEVIDEIKDSKLRGRGGAGFPTGIKWQFTADSKADIKYVLCNADEGDPGAFMDRSILEGDPHTILESMTIAGYCIGATMGYIYVRAEYPIAVNRLNKAIQQSQEYGLLGNDILGTKFNFNIEIRLGAGAFVCGEETALIASIEGKRGEPRSRPPFPAQKGVFGKPTLLNNVETYANITKIILEGNQEFKKVGTEKSSGTKVFALGGNIKNTGLVEVPMGTTLREIVYEIGGGIPNGKKFKAAQTGGPSGGCIPKEYLDTKIDYDSLMQIGSMMGSGGLIVMDEDTCMVDIAKFFLEFTVDESCGKCVPCRIGTKRMLEILDNITKGKGKDGDIEKLEILAKNISSSALCGLGQTAPNPVISTLKYFRNEYEDHIYNSKCNSHVCTALNSYLVIEEKCKSCGLCKKACPVNAINGTPGKGAFNINLETCISCGSCIEKCPFDAIILG